MMKRLLKNKTGVTILEGLIALGLLALVAGGTFGVLLSVSRKAAQPDIREEMLLAIERANEQLQIYAAGNTSVLPDEFKNGLCGRSTAVPVISDSAPLNTGTHQITCLLPAICDRGNGNSTFSYSVASSTLAPAGFVSGNLDSQFSAVPTKKITFNIKCNGFTL